MISGLRARAVKWTNWLWVTAAPPAGWKTWDNNWPLKGWVFIFVRAYNFFARTTSLPLKNQPFPLLWESHTIQGSIPGLAQGLWQRFPLFLWVWHIKTMWVTWREAILEWYQVVMRNGERKKKREETELLHMLAFSCTWGQVHPLEFRIRKIKIFHFYFV